MVIEIENLRKEFGDGIVAVNDISLSIKPGEIFGFLGPNGAGKSTTINILLGYVTPTAGHATVLGQDVRGNFAPTRDRIGILPEGYSLYDRLTAREHVVWVIRTKNATDNPDRILERVGITDAANRRVGGFSKGMKQRLTFGMALVGDPDLLILDEPSSGLDPTGIQEMRETIRELAADGTTVFFSSHVLPEVEAVCDRVGIMLDGELVALDEIDSLRAQAGGSTRITLTVESTPESLCRELEQRSSVQAATVDGDTVIVDCQSSNDKVDVVKHVDARTNITDIVAEKSSMENLFNKFTEESVSKAGYKTAGGSE